VNTKARDELIKVVIGLLMITAGVGYFISKTTITSTFIEVNGEWKLWSVFLVFLPAIIGVVLLIAKPQWLASKLVAAGGAIFLVVVIMLNSTIVLTERLKVIEWVAVFGLIILGAVSCFWGLFNKIKK
jgi:uncharacterized membrane protein